MRRPAALFGVIGPQRGINGVIDLVQVKNAATRCLVRDRRGDQFHDTPLFYRLRPPSSGEWTPMRHVFPPRAKRLDTFLLLLLLLLLLLPRLPPLLLAAPGTIFFLYRSSTPGYSFHLQLPPTLLNYSGVHLTGEPRSACVCVCVFVCLPICLSLSVRLSPGWNIEWEAPEMKLAAPLGTRVIHMSCHYFVVRGGRCHLFI